MLPSACGLGQHFQDLGHSFSLYGPPSRQITYIYWPRSFFCEFMDLDFVSVHKHAKKELGQYPAILTSHLVNNPYLFTSLIVSERYPENPAIWLVPEAGSIFLSPDQGHGNGGKQRGWNCHVRLVFVNELAVIVDFFPLFTLPWMINQRKFTSVQFSVARKVAVSRLIFFRSSAL